MTREGAHLVTPSPFTPLGAKGVGEGAIHTTPAAILCAINDALAPLGVRATEIPASSAAALEARSKRAREVAAPAQKETPPWPRTITSSRSPNATS